MSTELHFTDDEFERAKLPFVRARDNDLRNTRYWGYTVLHAAQQRADIGHRRQVEIEDGDFLFQFQRQAQQ